MKYVIKSNRQKAQVKLQNLQGKGWTLKKKMKTALLYVIQENIHHSWKINIFKEIMLFYFHMLIMIAAGRHRKESPLIIIFK